MRYTRILLLVLLFFHFVVNVSAQKKKTEEENLLLQTTPTNGIVYALPRTVLIIDVSIQKTTFVPGPYASYAEKYLGIKQVKSTPEEKYQMFAIDINTMPEPDPDAIFRSMNHAASITLNSDGIIRGIMVPGETSFPQMNGAHQLFNNKVELAFTDLSSDDYYEMSVDPATSAERIIFKTNEQKAREAADYLIRLRKKRAYTILDPSDVVPEDGKGYEVFLQEAARLEKAYTELFAGKTEQSIQHHQFIFVPEKEIKNELLFRYSDEKGILPKSDISGKPVMISLQSIPNVSKNIQNILKVNQETPGQSGIYYRVPVTAELSISDGLFNLYSGRLTLPQFGELVPVPEHLLNGQYVITYQIETGTIKEIKAKN